MWGKKCHGSDRVVVVYNKEYRKFLSAAIVWEHGEIYRGATDYFDPKPTYFLDDSALENPAELRAWLAQVVYGDYYDATSGGIEKCRALIEKEQDKFKEWDDFCRNEANLYDHTQVGHVISLTVAPRPRASVVTSHPTLNPRLLPPPPPLTLVPRTATPT